MDKKVTSSSTKGDILDAYNNILKELELSKVSASQKHLQQQELNTVQKVKVQNKADIIHEITGLKIKLTESLDILSSDLLLEREKLKHVQEAIEIENKRLKDLYDITASACSLEALMLAQREESSKFEQEMEEKKIALAKEQKAREIIDKEQEELTRKKWKRVDEEFEYQAKLKHQKEEDSYNVKKITLERELQDKKALAEKELLERETSLAAQEQELQFLRKSQESFDVLLTQKIDETKATIVKELEQQFKFNSELKARETTGEVSLLKQKIESLEEKLKEKQALVENMSKQLINAQMQAQDLAKKVIDGAAQRFVLQDTKQDSTKNGST